MSKKRIAKEILLLITLSILSTIIFFVADNLKSKSFNIENALNYKIERAQDSINGIRENNDYRKYEYEEIKKKGNVPTILEELYSDVKERKLNKLALNKQLNIMSDLNTQISNFQLQITEERFSYWRKIEDADLTEILIVLFIIVYPVRLIIELILWCVKTIKKDKPSS